MKEMMISAAAITLLAACSDGGADKDGDGKISDEEVAAEMNTVKMEAGQWETQMEVTDLQLDGLPEGAPPNMADMMKASMGQTSRSCVTKEQAENPGAQFFAAQKQTNCDVKEFDMSGGKIKSTMTCSGPQGEGSMNMTMSGDYTPSAYDMTMTMESSSLPNGMTMNVKANVTGKRVGDCTYDLRGGE